MSETNNIPDAFDGPFVVILGQRESQILSCRPPNIALSPFPGLLPIVVSCAHREHAEAIMELNGKLLGFSSHDAHSIAYAVQESDLDIPNDSGFKIYVIRKGIVGTETGVWVGFDWASIKHNIGDDLKGKEFTGKLDVKESIIYMVNKRGYNFPLRATGARIARPQRSIANRAGPESTQTCPPFPASTSPAKPSAASHSKPRRSPSPVKVPVRDPSPSSDESFVSAGSEDEGLDNALASLAVSRRGDSPSEREDALVLQILARIITPPASMIPADGNIFCLPISFGEEADRFLMRKGMSEGELWKLLQVCVHARNVDRFVHHLGHVLEHRFGTGEAEDLWAMIKFPCV